MFVCVCADTAGPTDPQQRLHPDHPGGFSFHLCLKSHSFAVLEGLHQVGVRNPESGVAVSVGSNETWP